MVTKKQKSARFSRAFSARAKLAGGTKRGGRLFPKGGGKSLTTAEAKKRMKAFTKTIRKNI